MRKNTARHWLHAALDLLPILLIPVFMIYSHRHEITGSSIEVPQKQVVNFNQLINQDVYQYESSVVDGQATWNNDTAPAYSIINYTGLTIGHTYTYRNLFTYINFDSGYAQPRVYVNGTAHSINGMDNFYLNYTFTATTNRIYVNFSSTYSGLPFDATSLFTLYDLTQMNLTIEEFNSAFPNTYYDYTLSESVTVDSTPILYDDSDIMSQFTYQMYNAVDKYFNMNNVFGMNNVYSWFEANIFHGTAPIYIYIVWQIVLYEFVMDLLFLLYALFMWFIDVTKRLIEKPLESIK